VIVAPLHPSQRRSFVVTLGLLTGLAAFTVDVSLPAVPVMVDALQTSLSHGQQIVGIFMLGMAFGQIPSGLVSDRVGRLPVMYMGMALFIVGAITAAAANSIEVMLAGRFVQGIGSAPALVLSRAIVRDISSGREAAKLMSIMTMIFTAAPVIAPSIGAMLVSQFGWRAPFSIIVVLGISITLAIHFFITETHTPESGRHPARQLTDSFAEFFSHRQSIFGLLLVVLPPAGFLSLIAVAAALVVEIYGFSITQFGLIFALAGISILVGSAINRWLVTRLDSFQVIALGVAFYGLSSASLLVMAVANGGPFPLLWGSICLFMMTVAIVMPNAMVIALDPLPRIAGVASSIIGTLQNLCGAAGAIIGARIYDGTVRNAIMIMAGVGILIVVIFSLKPLICPKLVQHPDELARD
jgi:DHA1 family bicyclomycin/chloramphenicol resistance-like MFS transporter